MNTQPGTRGAIRLHHAIVAALIAAVAAVVVAFINRPASKLIVPASGTPVDGGIFAPEVIQPKSVESGSWPKEERESIRRAIAQGKDIFQGGSAESSTGKWASNEHWRGAIDKVVSAGNSASHKPKVVEKLLEYLAEDRLLLPNKTNSFPAEDGGVAGLADGVIVITNKLTWYCENPDKLPSAGRPTEMQIICNAIAQGKSVLQDGSQASMSGKWASNERWRRAIDRVINACVGAADVKAEVESSLTSLEEDRSKLPQELNRYPADDPGVKMIASSVLSVLTVLGTNCECR